MWNDSNYNLLDNILDINASSFKPLFCHSITPLSFKILVLCSV